MGAERGHHEQLPAAACLRVECGGVGAGADARVRLCARMHQLSLSSCENVRERDMRQPGSKGVPVQRGRCFEGGLPKGCLFHCIEFARGRATSMRMRTRRLACLCAVGAPRRRRQGGGAAGDRAQRGIQDTDGRRPARGVRPAAEGVPQGVAKREGMCGVRAAWAGQREVGGGRWAVCGTRPGLACVQTRHEGAMCAHATLALASQAILGCGTLWYTWHPAACTPRIP
eukprot:365492-Chlamydomonas_euryale.AAC.16